MVLAEMGMTDSCPVSTSLTVSVPAAMSPSSVPVKEIQSRASLVPRPLVAGRAELGLGRVPKLTRARR